MKTLILFRHSFKTSDNHISLEGERLALAVADSQLGQAKNHVCCAFCNNLPRTYETLTAMGIDETSQVTVLNLLGSNELFAVMLEPTVNGKGFKDLAPTLGNRQAVKALHTSAMYNLFITLAHQAVKLMLGEMDNDSLAVGVFHSPTVEIAAEAYGHDCPDIFPEMSYVIFQMDNIGNIWVSKHWTCDIPIPSEPQA